MPKDDPRFGHNTDFVARYKEAWGVENDEPRRVGGCPVKTNYLDWNTEDLKILYTTWGYPTFLELRSLMQMANIDLKNVPDEQIANAPRYKPQLEGVADQRTRTQIMKKARAEIAEEIRIARNALTEVAPYVSVDGKKIKGDWFTFSKLMDQAVLEIKREGLDKPRTEDQGNGAVGLKDYGKDLASISPMNDLASSITLNQAENPAFDPHKAFKNIEMADANAGAKKPLETAITDAVKAIKGKTSLSPV